MPQFSLRSRDNLSIGAPQDLGQWNECTSPVGYEAHDVTLIDDMAVISDSARSSSPVLVHHWDHDRMRIQFVKEVLVVVIGTAL